MFFCRGRNSQETILHFTSANGRGGRRGRYGPWVKPEVFNGTSSRFPFLCKRICLSPSAQSRWGSGKESWIVFTTRWSFVYMNSFIVSVRGSPRGHTSHGLLTRTTLRTENLSNWCPQVAQRATVGICAPNTSCSLLSPSSHLSSFSFSFFPWESAHEQHLTRQSSLKIWKDCDEKTGLWDHIGLDSIVPPSVKSGQWAYLCQINEPGWRLSGCKTIYLRPPSWHAADCRLSSGRAWMSGLALSEHTLDCCPGKSFLRETESSTCEGRQASWGSGGEHRGFQLQIATHRVSGTSLETDIPLSLKNHHCEPQTWQNLAALNSDHPFPKRGIQKDGPPVSFPAIL